MGMKTLGGIQRPLPEERQQSLGVGDVSECQTATTPLDLENAGVIMTPRQCPLAKFEDSSLRGFLNCGKNPVISDTARPFSFVAVGDFTAARR